MGKDYQIILDQSTSGTKLLLLKKGRIVKRYDKKHRQIYPKTGWVEHDPLEIWNNTAELLATVFREQKVQKEDILAISITNQRETILAWDKITGKPLCNAIVWQCNRSSDICEALIEQGLEKVINQKTGLRLDPYFSGTKIKWLTEKHPAIAGKSGTGELAIGTMDSWLLWNLTQEKVFATDGSNACRTLLYNINTQQWDEELIQLFGINQTDLPEIRAADENFGCYQGIPIIGVMADSQAALLGEACTSYGDVKITMGTGCSVMMQIREQNNLKNRQILTTVAWQKKNEAVYALEGIIRSCGDAVNWFCQTIAVSEGISDLCNEVLLGNKEDIFFIPALQGMGAPFWDNTMTAAFFGIKRTTTEKEMLRAVLESIIFQIKAVTDAMEEVSGQAINQVFIDGGVSKNKALMILLASLLDKKVIVSEVEEYSALGVAALANPALQMKHIRQETIKPSQNSEDIHLAYKKWKRLIEQ
ncbi:FGGY-family carbohydrate kinase [Enterococcus sp. LJL128]|uniref:FGGY-family carbohydrate kinase n=1 Tax=Enterococcus sp. LJL51 TaxID=3416656 RepID=UPI003CEFDDBB